VYAIGSRRANSPSGSEEVDPIDWTGMDDVGAFLHYSGERADEKETEIA